MTMDKSLQKIVQNKTSGHHFRLFKDVATLNMHSETEMCSMEACVHQHGSPYSSMSDCPWTENAVSTEGSEISPTCSCSGFMSIQKQILARPILSGHPAD